MPVTVSWSVLVGADLSYSYNTEQNFLYFQHRFYVIPSLDRQQDTDDIEFIYRQANIRWSGNERYSDGMGYGYSYGYAYGTTQSTAPISDLLPVLEL